MVGCSCICSWLCFQVSRLPFCCTDVYTLASEGPVQGKGEEMIRKKMGCDKTLSTRQFTLITQNSSLLQLQQIPGIRATGQSSKQTIYQPNFPNFSYPRQSDMYTGLIYQY